VKFIHKFNNDRIYTFLFLFYIMTTWTVYTSSSVGVKINNNIKKFGWRLITRLPMDFLSSSSFFFFFLKYACSFINQLEWSIGIEQNLSKSGLVVEKKWNALRTLKSFLALRALTFCLSIYFVSSCLLNN